MLLVLSGMVRSVERLVKTFGGLAGGGALNSLQNGQNKFVLGLFPPSSPCLSISSAPRTFSRITP